MGIWLVRAVGIVVTAVLAGGPATAAVCDAMCSTPEPAPLTRQAHGPDHDHATADHALAPEAAAGRHHAAAGHDHHRSLEAAAASHARSARLEGLVGPHCCGTLDASRAAVAAVRAEATLLPAPQVSVPRSGALFDPVDRQPSGPRRAPPPGGVPPAPTPLVLRI